MAVVALCAVTGTFVALTMAVLKFWGKIVRSELASFMNASGRELFVSVTFGAWVMDLYASMTPLQRFGFVMCIVLSIAVGVWCCSRGIVRHLEKIESGSGGRNRPIYSFKKLSPSNSATNSSFVNAVVANQIERRNSRAALRLP